MKIALAHKRLDLNGGTERDLYRTAEGLRDLGHEIHLFCSEFGVAPPPGTLAHRIPVLPLGRNARFWSFALLGPRIIRKYRCDVTVSFERMPGAAVVRCGGGTHRGFLERLGREGGWPRRLWQRLSFYHRSVLAIEQRQLLAGHFKVIIAVSQEVKTDLLKYYPISGDRVVILYNGVDDRRFHPALRGEFRDIVRERWGIPRAAPVVLFIGSGFRRKGLDRLLSVWDSPGLRETYLLVVGDDSRMSWYRAQAKNVGGARVVFAGRQERVEQYYAAADLLALPAVQEAFGNVVLEALACGLPVLVSRSVGAAEVLRGSLADGIIDKPEEPAQLESKLATLLRRSSDATVCAQARALGEQFSWSNHFRQLEAILFEARDQIALSDLSHFTRSRLGAATIWFNPNFMAPAEAERLVDPDRLLAQSDCAVVKDQLKIKVARVGLQLGGNFHPIYVKRYNAFSWRFKLGSLFAASGAAKSLQGAVILSRAGIPTPAPVAAIEWRHWGVLEKSFYLSEEVTGGKTADAYWRETLGALPGRDGFRRRRCFLRGLAALFQTLHRRQIYHNDLKDANILVAGAPSVQAERFYLLDLEGIRRYRRLSWRRRVKNLVQLNRTLGRRARRTDKLYFLKCYLGPGYLEEGERRRWAGTIIGKSLQWDRNKIARGRVSEDSLA